MTERLNKTERRILGVLMEKALTQPDSYPMTVNAIIAGCNQKSNRDPVMDLDEETVWATLNTLRERGMVSMVLPGPGARTERFKHQLETRFEWQRRQRAIMAELFLRGPQTLGELRTRCSRMVPFESLEAVSTAMDSLAQLDPPVVAAMPRVPGQSVVRYTHLLAPEDEVEAAPPSTQAVAATVRPASDDAPSQVAQLERRVDALQEEVSALKQRLETIESQLL